MFSKTAVSESNTPCSIAYSYSNLLRPMLHSTKILASFWSNLTCVTIKLFKILKICIIKTILHHKEIHHYLQHLPVRYQKLPIQGNSLFLFSGSPLDFFRLHLLAWSMHLLNLILFRGHWFFVGQFWESNWIIHLFLHNKCSLVDLGLMDLVDFVLLV